MDLCRWSLTPKAICLGCTRCCKAFAEKFRINQRSRVVVRHKISGEQHTILALWAGACANRVLQYFESEQREDKRPRDAIELLFAWTQGGVTMQAVRTAAFASHAAARNAVTPAAVAAARAAGQAAGTAHVPEHALHAASYALKAVLSSSGTSAAKAEREWQQHHLPEPYKSIWLPIS
jgi:hypothetical protein